LREQQALDALGSIYGADGATATEWQAAAKMSEATFLRARKELTDRGLVVRDGDARRGARYRVQESVSE
jgi:DNA-binding IclR family transcriptional regulator